MAKRDITAIGHGVIVSNGHPVVRPSGKPRLMPAPGTIGSAPARRTPTPTTKRYRVILVETITREAVVEVDILPSQDNQDAERIVMERLEKGYDIPWSEPKKGVRASGWSE